MKTIFKRCLLFAYLLLLIPLLNHAQVAYTDTYADYLVEVKKDHYQVRATLKSPIKNSRRLQMARDKLRLKAVNLIGNYLVFNDVDFNYPHKEELFDVFVDHSQLDFEAHIEKFAYSSWGECETRRCIYFNCKKKDFSITHRDYTFALSLEEMLQYHFEKKRNPEAASKLIRYTAPSLAQSIQIENLFLSGRGILDEALHKLLNSNTPYHLQLSLFEEDTLFRAIYREAAQLPPPTNEFEKFIRAKILFTSAPTEEKATYDSTYLASLSHLEGLWFEMQLFAASNIGTDFPGWEEATVFDVIMYYPLTLNFFNMNLAHEGDDYRRALELFRMEDFEGSLQSLKKEINFKGISPAALNLTGASYRLLGEYPKALSFLLLAYQMNQEQTYTRGNIYRCLQALEFPHINDLQQEFLHQPNLDPWSKNQLENSKNN